jgi:UDP-glucuronate decarboxylase
MEPRGDVKGETHMARILITGGAGFIGSHLVEYLLRQDHEILCLDNYFTGSKDNLLHLRDHPRLEMIRHDVVNPINLEVDQVFHLACPASPVHYQYNPVKTIKTNVLGTLNMLGLAKRVKARILLASTSEVYGDPQVHPQPEGYWGNVNPIGIRSCYDEGKRVAETLMMDYHRQNGVDTRIARIFNTFGPRMALNDGRVISNFIVQALTGQDITIYGEGQQTRSFSYVSDLVEGLTRLMNRDPGEYTIIELAEKVLGLINTPSAIIHRELPLDDPGRRRPDITRARELLDWQPTVPLLAGLKETIPYFAAKLKQENIPVAASLNF